MMFADKVLMFLSMLNPGALAIEIIFLEQHGERTIFPYFHPFRLLS